MTDQNERPYAWQRPWLCRTPGCGWLGLNPGDLDGGRCRWCKVGPFVVERSWEGSGIAPGDRIVFTRDRFLNLGIPPVE